MDCFTYDDFIEKVNELGFFLPVSGFPSASSFIKEGQQWSGKPDLDPWLWKDRAPSDKKLAYTSLCGGRKGFIAPKYYSIFYDAFHPNRTMDERQDAGLLSYYEWKLWNLLSSEGRALGTHEYRKLLGVKTGNGKSALDTAVLNLQLTFEVTLTGPVDMLDKNGIAYNTSVGCGLIEDWVPEEWMSMNPRMEHEEAFDIIIRRACEVSELPADYIVKAFGKQLSLRNRMERA
jgi:hypothetical protein